MASRFENVPQEVLDIIERMVRLYHKPFLKNGVTFEAVFAFGKEVEATGETTPALVERGFAVDTKVKVSSPEDRTLGRPDVKISIDGDKWEILSADECEATIDRALESLEFVEAIVDGVTVIVRDSAERPKLRKKKPDHMHEWFDATVRRHGKASPEWEQCETFLEKREQLWLPYIAAEDDQEQDERETSVTITTSSGSATTTTKKLQTLADAFSG